MASWKKKVVVVGGGFLGISSIAALEEEDCFEPVCFEKTNKPWGTWCYKETSSDGVASIMPTTIINHSKEVGAISNFPPRKEYNNFMRHHEVNRYFMEYANEKDLLKYIQFNTVVEEVKRCNDYEESGRWTVTVRNMVSGEVTTDVYDGVLICVGHINRPKMPSYPGQELFKGKIMHTHGLKEVAPYRNKNIVVVGMGCSGLDAAVETSNVAKQVYLSTRFGAHVLNRIGPNGYPFDYVLVRRCYLKLLDILPADLLSWMFECCYLDPRFDYRLYPVKPKHHILARDPVINDHITSKLLSGSVIQKPAIKCFTEDGVIFEGESEVTNIDVVIMATGYTWKFPFLEKGIVVEEDGKFNLYKCMFPSHLPHPTLAVMGFVLPFGPGFPLGELQCRWVAQVLAGKSKLPSKEVMIKDINDTYAANLLRYKPGDKMSLRCDYIQYCDDIASQFGAKPNLFKMLFTDPMLAFQLIFGPSLSYQYRLQGPHTWEGAREAIMTSKERVVWPLKKDNSETGSENFIVNYFKIILKLMLFN